MKLIFAVLDVSLTMGLTHCYKQKVLQLIDFTSILNLTLNIVELGESDEETDEQYE